MTLPVPAQITFRGVPHSDALEADIRERVGWLETFYDRLVGCHVLVELPHRHRHDGRHFHVRIELTVPGGEDIVISREPSLHAPTKALAEEEHHKSTETAAVNQYAHVAVHEAFRTARRRLQDFARQQREDVKTHETPAHGQVSGLWPLEAYGFIESGGRQVYFSRASVLNDAFDALTVGAPVVFVEERGEKGPQASSVRLLGKHHYVAG